MSVIIISIDLTHNCFIYNFLNYTIDMKTLIILLVVSALAFSQEKKIKSNILYVELLGNGLFSSLNYEGMISNNFSARIGVGFWYDYSVSNSGSHHDLGFDPLAMLNYLIEIYGNNYIELGGGVLIATTTFTIGDTFGPSSFTIVPTTAIGYRYSPNDGGFFISAAFDMFISSGIFPWGGVGLGYRF